VSVEIYLERGERAEAARKPRGRENGSPRIKLIRAINVCDDAGKQGGGVFGRALPGAEESCRGGLEIVEG